MPLKEVELTIQSKELPAEVREFLDEADARISSYYESKAVRPSGFVPSDFVAVYHALRAISESGLSPGHSFCEWGSGFGVVASLAAMLEFDAYGIEISNELVEAARRLADDYSLPVEFVQGSFIPVGSDALADEAFAEHQDHVYFLVTESDHAYTELGLGPDDADIVFAYPWPGEEYAIEGLFENNAAAGALLLTYNSCESVRLQRLVLEKSHRR